MESISAIAGAVGEILERLGWVAGIAGVVFWVAAAPYLLSGLSSAVSLLLRFFRKAPLARVVTARLGLGALLLGVVNTGVLVQFFRSRFLAGVSCENPHCTVALNLIAECNVLVAAGLATVVLGALVAIAALSTHGLSRRFPVIDLAGCGVVAFLGLVARRLGLALDEAIIRGEGPWLRRDQLNEFAAAWARTEGGLLAGFVACTVLGAGAWTAVSLRRRQECTRMEFALASLVLTAGVGAFAATRNHSYDAKHLVPYIEFYWPIEPGAQVAGRLPPPRGCGPEALLPAVHFERGQVWSEGVAFGPAGDAGIREAARQKLSDLRRQYEELHELSRAELDPSALGIDLLAPLGTPMAQVMPVLQAAREAGYPQANVGSLFPNVTNTRTLGPFVRYSRCATAFDLAGDGELPTAFATWGDLARAAGERRLRLNVTPAAAQRP